MNPSSIKVVDCETCEFVMKNMYTKGGSESSTVTRSTSTMGQNEE